MPSAATATAAAWALGSAVAGNLAAQDAARDVGAIEPLIALLRAGGGAKCTIGALWALGNLAKGCPPNQEALLRGGTLSQLVAALHAGAAASEVEGAAWTLHNLVEGNERARTAAREAGAIPALTRLLGSGPDSVVTECAARTLHALAMVGFGAMGWEGDLLVFANAIEDDHAHLMNVLLTSAFFLGICCSCQVLTWQVRIY